MICFKDGFHLKTLFRSFGKKWGFVLLNSSLFWGVVLIPSAPFLSTETRTAELVQNYNTPEGIRLYVLRKGLTRTNPIVGMGCLDHQTYCKEGYGSLGRIIILFQLPGNSAIVTFLLVGGWTTHLKNMSQTGSFPQEGIKIIKTFESTSQFGMVKWWPS